MSELETVEEIIRTATPPIVTASEVAEELDCSSRHALDLLRLLERANAVQSKTVGAHAVAWWHVDRVTPAGATLDEEQPTRGEPPADSTTRSEPSTSAEDVLRSLDLPGSGSKYETRVQAVLAFYERLQEHPGEPLEKGDFEDLVEERDLDVGYSSFRSLWNNWVKSNRSQGRDTNTLAQLPGVEIDGDTYVFHEGIQ